MRYEYYEKVGEWRWRLMNGDEEIVASGERYDNLDDCLRSIALVKNSSDSPVEEVVHVHAVSMLANLNLPSL